MLCIRESFSFITIDAIIVSIVFLETQKHVSNNIQLPDYNHSLKNLKKLYDI